jgi:hypothetical protein
MALFETGILVNFCFLLSIQATTDLMNQCTTSHTGTSASAPLAAGEIFFMLISCKMNYMLYIYYECFRYHCFSSGSKVSNMNEMFYDLMKVFTHQ